jgi:hypothetical protein
VLIHEVTPEGNTLEVACLKEMTASRRGYEEKLAKKPERQRTIT